MSETLDTFLISLRNQAEALARGVVAPPMAPTAVEAAANATTALDELDGISLEASDAALIFEWLAEAGTHSAVVVAGDLSLQVSDVEAHSIPLSAGFVPEMTDELRTAIGAELVP